MNHSRHGVDSAESERQSALLQSLSQGMHDIAQPLAIMQGKLELCVMKGDAANCLAAIEESLHALSRVVELFSYLRELVRIAKDDEPQSAVQIIPLVLSVAEDLGCIIRASGVQFQLECPERLPLIHVCETRVRQALFYALQAVQSVSRAPDTVLLAVVHKAATIEVCVANHSQSTHIKPEGCEFKRAITLTKAIVEAQQGSFCYHQAPLAVTICFPLVGYHETAPGKARYQRNE